MFQKKLFKMFVKGCQSKTKLTTLCGYTEYNIEYMGAGPPCRPGRPARFFFEGPRAPLGSGRGAPGGASGSISSTRI